MKKGLVWALLALLVVVAVVLTIALPKRAGLGQDVSRPRDLSQQLLDEGERPLDSFAHDDAAALSDSAEQEDEELVPNIDPGTGMELEENELPIMTP